MQRIELAPGLTTSRVAWGFWRWTEWGISISELQSLVPQVLDLGISLIDHADIYSDGHAEVAFGEVLKKNPSLRDRMEIISKSTIVYPRGNIRVKYYDTSKKHIISQAEASLQNLNTDHLDLLLLHRPDPMLDPAETAEALEQLYKDGKVRAVGVSNYKRADISLLQSYLSIPLVVNQIEASVLCHENFDDWTIQYGQEHRMHPIAWSPLAGGRIFTSEDPTAIRVREALETVREDLGAPAIDDVALAWLFSHPAEFLTITGACDLDFIKRPIEALDYTLTREQWFMIWSAYTGHKVL